MKKYKKKKEVRVIRNYSFWRHPIKWFKDRKIITLLDAFVKNEWEQGLRDEYHKLMVDNLMYGTSIFDIKSKKRVDPEKLRK